MTSYLNYVLTLHEKIREGWLEHAALSELQKNNEELYGRILPGAYETSYANPAYAVRMLQEEYGRLLSFLAAEVRGIVVYAYEDRLFDMTVLMELLCADLQFAGGADSACAGDKRYPVLVCE